MIKKQIKDRINTINKQMCFNDKPSLVFINRNKKGWDIIEHYYKPKYQVSYKNYFYADYNNYLDNANLEIRTPVIINSIYYEN